MISSFETKIVNCSGTWGEYIEKILNNNDNKCINNCLLSKTQQEQNCYQICSYYFYFNKNTNKYECTDDYLCPSDYPKFIIDKNECTYSCQENKEYIYEYNNLCFKKCPDYFELRDDKPFFCFPKCPKDFPFLLIEAIKCVDYRTISQRQNKLCITAYFGEDNNNIIDIVINQTRWELLNEFNYSVINGNAINETGIKYFFNENK